MEANTHMHTLEQEWKKNTHLKTLEQNGFEHTHLQTLEQEWKQTHTCTH